MAPVFRRFMATALIAGILLLSKGKVHPVPPRPTFQYVRNHFQDIALRGLIFREGIAKLTRKAGKT